MVFLLSTSDARYTGATRGSRLRWALFDISAEWYKAHSFVFLQQCAYIIPFKIRSRVKSLTDDDLVEMAKQYEWWELKTATYIPQ